jgi:hypothetical protein
VAFSLERTAHTVHRTVYRQLLPSRKPALVSKAQAHLTTTRCADLGRRLIGKDRTDEAWKVTCKLHRSKEDPEDTYAHAEYAQMMAQITFERQHNAVGTLAQARLAFSQKSFLRRLGLGCLVQFGNQCTGALVIK